MPQAKISEQWEDIPPLVEKIISARTVSREVTATRGATTSVSTIVRPFRFREFATEIKVDNGLAYRWIRGGVKPHDEGRSKIIAWCKKHCAELTK